MQTVHTYCDRCQTEFQRGDARLLDYHDPSVSYQKLEYVDPKDVHKGLTRTELTKRIELCGLCFFAFTEIVAQFGVLLKESHVD